MRGGRPNRIVAGMATDTLALSPRGQTLEIGGGTGLNLVHYPDDLDGLVLAEPDPSMRKRLQTAVRRSERKAQVIDAHAERLPFSEPTRGTVDTTAASLSARFQGRWGCRCGCPPPLQESPGRSGSPVE
jgi:hypothetical protein